TRNYRTAYDILVRPHGSTTPLERRAGLVRNNYLSGIYGGISFAQWHKIERIAGVAVAAPIANVGFVFEPGSYWFSIRRAFTKAPTQLYRVTYTYVANNRLSRYPYARNYVYYTTRDRFVKGVGQSGFPLERVPGVKGEVRSCNAFYENLFEPHPPFFGAQPLLYCFAGPRFYNVTYFPRYDNPALRMTTFIPLIVSAIDPVAEAKLVHLDRAVVAGRYLRESDSVYKKHVEGLDTGLHAKFDFRFAPTLISDRPYVDEQLEIRVDRLGVPPGVNVPDALAAGACQQASFPCPSYLQFPVRADAPFKTG